jgi:hypothetical protein
VASIFLGELCPFVGVQELEIDFEELREVDEWGHFRLVDKVVERKDVSGIAQIAADRDDFVGGIHRFQDFNDDALRGKKSSYAEFERQLINIDEGAGKAREMLQFEECEGIRDDAGGRIAGGLKKILRTAAEEQFVGVHVQPLIKDGLARNESFVHVDSCCTERSNILSGYATVRAKPAPAGRGVPYETRDPQVGADMEPRNSLLDFDFVSRLKSSSMASTVESGLSTLRRTQTRLSSSGGRSSSSLRVPER